MYLIENDGWGEEGGKKNMVRAIEYYIHRFTKLSMWINTNVKEIIVSGLQ